MAYLCRMMAQLKNKIGELPLIFWFYSVGVLSWLYRFEGGVLLHQLAEPVLRNAKTDALYWLLNYTNVCRYLVVAPASYLLDGALLTCSVALIGLSFLEGERFLWLRKRVAILYSVSLLLYIVTFNTFQTMHTHYLDGFLVMSVVFWFKRPTTQGLLLEGVRYYTCWVYSCAFCWKLARGFWRYPLHAKAIMIAENAAYLAQNPTHYLAQAQQYLIQHPALAHALLDAGMLVQGLFLVGFFTKKIDKLLFWLPFAFHLATYFLLDVAFWEFLILQLSFLYVQRK